MSQELTCIDCGRTFPDPGAQYPPLHCPECKEKVASRIVAEVLRQAAAPIPTKVTAAYKRWKWFKHAYEQAMKRGHGQQALAYLYAERRAYFDLVSVRDGVPPIAEDSLPHYVQIVLDFYGEDWPD